MLVDRPTQLIHIGISICQHTSTKDIAGQSARSGISEAVANAENGFSDQGSSSWRAAGELPQFEFSPFNPNASPASGMP